jgi:aspartyl-tRNA(Asn)/glutamyl-tRNA(Gln) amidotransferase subunit B
MEWETVIGLEIHAQLATRSKILSGSATAYGAEPNTQANLVDLGYPGVLPVLNGEAVRMAVRFGLSIGARIATHSVFARKNYFYPDLPKGYQISQYELPVVAQGWLDVVLDVGTRKRVGITRAHLEEDAGKSLHEGMPGMSGIDLNRAGTPLIEIVSEPDLRSAKEAVAYMKKVHTLVRYLDICDGNMEEGSLRCDANISVRRKGTTTFGTRTEVKNLNSFKNVQRAIEFEAQRQSEVLEAGGTISMETRTFDAVKGTTMSLRSKEMAHDYRYFPEPDIQPLTVSEAKKEAIRKAMPPLPRELYARYISVLGLSAYDAEILTDNKETALYYEELLKHTRNAKGAANWVMGDVRSWINERGLTMHEFPVKAEQLAGLIALIDGGKVSHTVASQKLFPLLVGNVDATAEALATSNGLLLDTNEDVIEAAVNETMARYPDKVAAYRAGNKGLLGLFMGEVMKATKGKADPRRANELVKHMLDGQND